MFVEFKLIRVIALERNVVSSGKQENKIQNNLLSDATSTPTHVYCAFHSRLWA